MSNKDIAYEKANYETAGAFIVNVGKGWQVVKQI